MIEGTTPQDFARRTFSRRTALRWAGMGGAGAFGLALLGPLAADAATGGAEARRDPVQRRDGGLRVAMRKLWEDHIVWTRMFIVSFAAGLPDLDAATTRLLRNQADIGDAVKPYLGDAAGDQLTTLLRGHILGAADILTAAQAGDVAGVDAGIAAWRVNAADIAALLHGANPTGWDEADLAAMMNEHLDLTLAEATARLTGDWDADVKAYDQVHEAILHMADMLADGLSGGNRGGPHH